MTDFRLPNSIYRKLEKRAQDQSLRKLTESDSSCIDFSSNDYLGISRLNFKPNKHLSQGATGSRLISGNYRLINRFEQVLANYFGYPSALMYTSGYLANLGIMGTLPSRSDLILYDSLVHTSIREGITLSKAKSLSFAHNNYEHLHQRLKIFSNKYETVWIVLESLYSMDGDMPPLEQIAKLAQHYKAYLIIDEAHAVGTIAPRGLVYELGIQESVTATIVTFGKAMGSHGAAVLSSKDIASYQINFSKPFIYTTTLPPESIDRLMQTITYYKKTISRLRACLINLAEHFDKEAKQAGLITNSLAKSPIKTIRVGDVVKVKNVSKALHALKLNVKPILSPTVLAGQECLRVCLHTFNTEEQVSYLVQQLKIQLL